jgi:parallel beta-helix repeat protein
VAVSAAKVTNNEPSLSFLNEIFSMNFPPRPARLQSLNSGLHAGIFLCVFFGLSAAGVCDETPVKAAADRVLEVTADITLDPSLTYGRIVILKSGITIDGQGAWLVGNSNTNSGNTKDYQGTAITADGISNVTLRNINAKGWESGLHIRNGEGWTIENNNFCDNFHDPDFGWGENGRRGGLVLEKVHQSTIAGNKANRVWDACVLVDSNDNVLRENDFSHTSNTCLKLWTACRNTIQNNVLSHGIRISPGEVHARDSTCVLIESGSDENRILTNDCTHGGDGIFVRVLNGWCSTGNYFEGNDCSYANNNGFECWAPRNTFVRNKANHCSYGFWLGGSDKSRLIENEASFNGLAAGHHNSPHLPGNGHAGIVFMFGSSSHTVARGNVCRGNNGAGIALIGDLESKGQKWKAWHWIIERNSLSENRWGLYAKYADWLTLTDNQYSDNTAKDILLDGSVDRVIESSVNIPPAQQPPSVQLHGPVSVTVGAQAAWDASGSTDPAGVPMEFTWDIDDGQLRHGPVLAHTFDHVGFHRIGLNVSNGFLTEPAWQDIYVIRDAQELGTEGHANHWSAEDFHDRTRSNEQKSRAAFHDDEQTRLVGKSALHVVIDPYAGFRAALTLRKSPDEMWALAGKTKLCFWLKAINADVTGWQGGPFIVLHGDDNNRCYIEPSSGRDLMREADHSEAREGWRLFEIPLDGDDRWRRDGDLPAQPKAITLAFDSWGAPPLQIWIDGLAFE